MAGNWNPITGLILTARQRPQQNCFPPLSPAVSYLCVSDWLCVGALSWRFNRSNGNVFFY